MDAFGDRPALSGRCGYLVDVGESTRIDTSDTGEIKEPTRRCRQ